VYAPPSLGDSGPERVTEIRSWATTTTEARVSRGEEDYAPKTLRIKRLLQVVAHRFPNRSNSGSPQEFDGTRIFRPLS